MTHRRGFTLIEMLIVVIIIATLAVIAIPRARDAVYRAEAVDLLSRVRKIQSALAATQLPDSLLRAGVGSVPPLLAAALDKGTMNAKERIRLGLTGGNATNGGPGTKIMIMAADSTGVATSAGRKVLYFYHKLEADEHKFNVVVAFVPLIRTPCTTPRPNGCSLGTR